MTIPHIIDRINELKHNWEVNTGLPMLLDLPNFTFLTRQPDEIEDRNLPPVLELPVIT